MSGAEALARLVEIARAGDGDANEIERLADEYLGAAGDYAPATREDAHALRLLCDALACDAPDVGHALEDVLYCAYGYQLDA